MFWLIPTSALTQSKGTRPLTYPRKAAIDVLEWRSLHQVSSIPTHESTPSDSSMSLSPAKHSCNSKLPATAYLALQPMPPRSACPASSVHNSQHTTHSCTTSPHVHCDSSQCTTHPCTTGTHEHLNPHAIPLVPPNPQASCDAGTECLVSLFAHLHCNFLNAFLNTTHCIYVE